MAAIDDHQARMRQRFDPKEFIAELAGEVALGLFVWVPFYNLCIRLPLNETRVEKDRAIYQTMTFGRGIDAARSPKMKGRTLLGYLFPFFRGEK